MKVAAAALSQILMALQSDFAQTKSFVADLYSTAEKTYKFWQAIGEDKLDAKLVDSLCRDASVEQMCNFCSRVAPALRDARGLLSAVSGMCHRMGLDCFKSVGDMSLALQQDLDSLLGSANESGFRLVALWARLPLPKHCYVTC